MKRILPEKTVELWTACSLVDILTPDVWIWSRSSYVDQDVWTPDLRKWLVLELKAPKPPRHQRWAGCMDFEIDLEQLRTYIKHFNQGCHSDVVYVLSEPSRAPLPWSNPPSAPTPKQPVQAAHPHNRWTFPKWSYVISATNLAWLLGNRYNNKGPVDVHLEKGCLQSDAHGPRVPLHSLHRYLTAVYDCYQWPTSVACARDARQQPGEQRTLAPFGTTDDTDPDSPRDAPRIRADLIEAGILDDEAPEAELELNADMLASAVEALGNNSSRHQILVGVT